MEPGAIGLIGLAVMGQNLALNLAEKGHSVMVHNRTQRVTDQFLADTARGLEIRGAYDLGRFCSELPRPRRIILMVKAGSAVDEVMAELGPHLEAGDVVVDGGNSHWKDTNRRVAEQTDKRISFIGAGISGGEEGARFGPSIMPGGNERGWESVGPSLQAISAKVEGEPCCAWLGTGGSGHFVKMVHNGIEYADMQLIAETYHLLRAGGRSVVETAAIFDGWRTGPLNSFLIDITATILATPGEDGEPLVESVLDAAAQKGTGRWTIETALEVGQPATVISEAVLARSLSALKDQRVEAARVLKGPDQVAIDVDDLESALLAAKVISYAQGFMTITAGSAEQKWDLDPARIAPLWRGGCIIRAKLLSEITAAYKSEPGLPNLLLSPHFGALVGDHSKGLRNTVRAAAEGGIPVPAMSSALSFWDGYRNPRLPANLIQAQRDFFGAHTYERVDRPRGERYHTDWRTGVTRRATP